MKNSVIPETWTSRLEDYKRHLVDLRDNEYHGSIRRQDRESQFVRQVGIIDSVVQQVLDRFNETMLANTGSIEFRSPHDDGRGGIVSLWLLSWPCQMAASRRIEGMLGPGSDPPPVLEDTGDQSIDPIIVRAFMPKDSELGGLHGHICGGRYSINSMWPLNLVTHADAERQMMVIWVIAEGELHRCTFEFAHAPMTLLPEVS